MQQLDQARGAGVRPALPHLHDPAPPRRRLHGEAAVRHATAPPRTRPCSSSPPTSTSIRPPRSPGWRRCSPRSRSQRRTPSDHQGIRHGISSPTPLRCRSPSASLPRRAPRSTSLGGDAGARRHHVDHGAEPRSARRPQGRADATPARPPGTCGWSRRRRRREQFVGITNSDLALHRQLRHPGQLQRLPGLGHLQPAQADARRRRTSAPPRRATSRSTRTCSSSRARASRAGSTAARRACRTR